MLDREVIDEASFSDVVGNIYDCVLEPSRWPGTLALIASITQSASSCVVINDTFDPRGGSIFEYGVDQKFLRLYFERHETADVRPIAEQARDVGGLATIEMLCRQEHPFAFDLYKDFVKPQGFNDLIALQLLRSDRRIGWLSAVRSGVQLRYRERERQVMRLLSPHLCHALALSDVIDLAALSADRLEQTVNALSAGVFLTDREGRIVYMNKSAEHQINTGNALQIVNGRLTATNQKANAVLARALAVRACTDSADSRGASLALPDGNGTGYLANVLPLDGGARRELMAPFRAITGVFVQDPIAAPRTAGEAFARLYGLTGAELKVLLTLAPGLTAKDAAGALGLREPTIKTHLQRIYEKTGMSRQSELVRLLLSHTPPLR